jgi:CDP-diacylglycerol---serine O-phosphatidyltransferase
MIVKNIPNAITCANLVCGVIGIIFLFSGHEIWAAYCIFLAAIFDFFDGFAARLLKVSSPIGKDLDSLADAVTFGILPSLILFKCLQMSAFVYLQDHAMLMQYLPYIAILIAVFSVWRLAKFNNDSRQSDSFIGVPTPANGICVAGTLLLVDPIYFEAYNQIIQVKAVVPESILNNPFISAFSGDLMPKIDTEKLPFYFNPWLIVTYIILMSFLLVSDLPLFALKFKDFKWKGNEIKWMFLLLSLILLLFLQVKSIPLIILLYVIMSVVVYLFRSKKKHEV